MHTERFARRTNHAGRTADCPLRTVLSKPRFAPPGTNRPTHRPAFWPPAIRGASAFVDAPA